MRERRCSQASGRDSRCRYHFPMCTVRVTRPRLAAALKHRRPTDDKKLDVGPVTSIAFPVPEPKVEP